MGIVGSTLFPSMPRLRKGESEVSHRSCCTEMYNNITHPSDYNFVDEGTVKGLETVPKMMSYDEDGIAYESLFYCECSQSILIAVHFKNAIVRLSDEVRLRTRSLVISFFNALRFKLRMVFLRTTHFSKKHFKKRVLTSNLTH